MLESVTVDTVSLLNRVETAKSPGAVLSKVNAFPYVLFTLDAVTVNGARLTSNTPEEVTVAPPTKQVTVKG